MKTVTLKQYTADAFTDRVFSGNPAAVCTVKADGGWALRWFTPGGEIDLCGHATLGTAFVLMHFYEKDAERIAFSTRSGALTVERRDSLYEMDFPAYDLAPVPVTDDMAAALGARPDAAYMGRDLLCVFGSADTVRALSPDMEALKDLPGLLAHATAPSDGPGRPGVRLRPLPHRPLLERPSRQKSGHRIPGIHPGRRALLPHGRRAHENGGKRGSLRGVPAPSPGRHVCTGIRKPQ